MCQLIKPNGAVAIILPQTILSDTKKYLQARQIMLEHFIVKGIVLLGGQAFWETGTQTAVFFLKKRKQIIELSTKERLEKATQNDGKIVIVNSGTSTKEQEKFLGYSFSKRRGNEGIKEDDENNLLYDEKDSYNTQKANSYILRNYEDTLPLDVETSLKNHVMIMPFTDCFDWESEAYSVIYPKKKIKIISNYELVKIGTILNFLPKSKRSAAEGKETGLYPFFNSAPTQTLFIDTADYDELSLIVGDGGRSGVHLSRKFSASSHNFILTCNNPLLLKYIYYYLQGVFDILCGGLKGLSLKNISKDYLQKFVIPLAPETIQQKIVRQSEEQDRIIKESNDKVIIFKNKIEEITMNIEGIQKKLGDILTLEYGVSLPAQHRKQGDYPVYGSNGIIGYHNNFYVASPAIIVGRKGSAGEINWADKSCTPIDTTFFVRLIDNSKHSLRFIYYILKNMKLTNNKTGLGSGGINRQKIYTLEITLPSLEKQEKIVSQLEKQEQNIVKLHQAITEAKGKKKEIIDKLYSIS